MEDRVLPTINLDRCTGCGLCVEYCPTDAVEMVMTQPMGRRPVITRPQDCAYCGMCEEICPEAVIALVYEIVLPSTSKQAEKHREHDLA